MKKFIKIAALAIAGACVAVLSYVTGANDSLDEIEKYDEACKYEPEPEEEENLGTDTQ